MLWYNTSTMPITSSALKALRQARKRTLARKPIKSRVKTMIDAMKKSPSKDALSGAFSAIDRAVKKNIFHKNKGARLKSQLSKLIANLGKK